MQTPEAAAAPDPAAAQPSVPVQLAADVAHQSGLAAATTVAVTNHGRLLPAPTAEWPTGAAVLQGPAVESPAAAAYQLQLQ